MITREQALEALWAVETWLGDVAPESRKVLRQYIEQGAQPGADVVLTEDRVEWVVNDIAELGVKIGNQFFFLYKGHSLVYGQDSSDVIDGVAVNHDADPPIKHHWRPVFKREFGECCHPVNYEDLRQCGHPHKWGTVSLGDSDEWKPLPAAPQPQQEQTK